MTRTLVTDSTDFCGKKLLNFMINDNTTTLLKANNSDFIYFSPLASTKHFGVAEAKIYAHLERLPQVLSVTKSFTVTTLGSIVPLISNKIYQVGQPELQIVFDAFKVEPGSYDAG